MLNSEKLLEALEEVSRLHHKLTSDGNPLKTKEAVGESFLLVCGYSSSVHFQNLIRPTTLIHSITDVN